MLAGKEVAKRKNAHKTKKKAFFLASFFEYLRLSVVELKKINWSTRKETLMASVAVLAVVFVVSLYLGIVDVIVAALVRYLLAL